MIPFDLNANACDYLALMAYRVECIRKGRRGLVIQDGEEYFVNEMGRYEGSKFPPIEYELMELNSKIAKGQA